MNYPFNGVSNGAKDYDKIISLEISSHGIIHHENILSMGTKKRTDDYGKHVVSLKMPCHGDEWKKLSKKLSS